MRAPSPAFSFYPKDWLSDARVRSMSWAAKGVYIELLAHLWLEGELPLDLGHIRRLLRMPAPQFTQIWTTLAPCFETSASGFHQPRLDHEIEKQKLRAGIARKNGQKGGRPPQFLANRPTITTQRVISGLAESNPEKSFPSSSPSPIKRTESVQNTDSVSGVQNHRTRGPAVKGNGQPPNPDVKTFLTWFQAEYRTNRHGADYLVKWARDAPLVKQLLHATSLARLQKLAQVLLSDLCNEPFIVQSDRGIGVLSARFNWLSDRLAAWEAKQQTAS